MTSLAVNRLQELCAGKGVLPEVLLSFTDDEIREAIRSVSFYNRKVKGFCSVALMN